MAVKFFISFFHDNDFGEFLSRYMDRVLSSLPVNRLRSSKSIADNELFIFDANTVIADIAPYVFGEWFAPAHIKAVASARLDQASKIILLSRNSSYSSDFINSASPYSEINTLNCAAKADNLNIGFFNAFVDDARDRIRCGNILSQMSKVGRLIKNSTNVAETMIFITKRIGEQDDIVIMRIDICIAPSTTLDEEALAIRAYCDHYQRLSTPDKAFISVCSYELNTRSKLDPPPQ